MLKLHPVECEFDSAKIKFRHVNVHKNEGWQPCNKATPIKGRTPDLLKQPLTSSACYTTI